MDEKRVVVEEKETDNKTAFYLAAGCIVVVALIRVAFRGRVY